jgi:hypothetical protein
VIAAVVRRLERRPGRVLLAIGLACTLAYLAALVVFPKRDGRIVIGDAVHYYVYLRSAVFDRDLHFHNDYVRLYGITQPDSETEWMYEPLPSGYIRNMMPIGPALVWAPLFLIVSLGVSVARVAGIAYPLDGYARAFQASAGVSGILAATVGAWLAYRAARTLFDNRSALWAVVATWLGTSAIYYSLVSPTYSHAASMLATSAFVYVWLARPLVPGDERLHLGRFALWGAAAGFAALVRWQDAVLLAAPAVDIGFGILRGPGAAGRRAARGTARGLALGIAALLVFSPQIFVWELFYRQPFVVPQGDAFMRWTDAALGKVLFSDFHGLFSWTPLAFVAVGGVFLLVKRDARGGLGLLLVFFASWYANAAAADWWAGEAFGARRFVSCFPIFVLGLSAVFERLRGRPAAVAAIVCVPVALNLLLLFQYQVFMKGWRDIAPYPGGAWNLWVERFIVPWRVLSRLVGL